TASASFKDHTVHLAVAHPIGPRAGPGGARRYADRRSAEAHAPAGHHRVQGRRGDEARVAGIAGRRAPVARGARAYATTSRITPASTMRYTANGTRPMACTNRMKKPIVR